MILLAWDTETTGFVNDREKPDHPSQPHLVQLGLVLYDSTGAERTYASVIVKPDGWTIPARAAAVHGITTEIADEVGVPLVVPLALFSQLAKVATEHAAHNLQFDLKVMQAAFHRVGRPFPAINPRCTQELADPLTGLPPTQRMVDAGYGHKSKVPSLAECVRFFFDEDLPGAHDALVDARACGRVFLEIQRRQGEMVG